MAAFADGDEIGSKRQALLDFLSSPRVFAAASALRRLLGGVPAVFALSQGGSDYGGALDTDSGMLNTALGAAKGLLSMFKEYAKPETLKYLLTCLQRPRHSAGSCTAAFSGIQRA